MSNKSAYLKAMGIDVWLERKQTISDTEKSIKIISGSAEVKEAIKQTPELNKAKPQTVELNIETLDWQALQSVVADCRLCDLSQTRKQVVFGAGNKNASLMIVAEAPGAEEDLQGQPFVGKSGQLLTAMLKAMGYLRNDVYITNILKCHPSQNCDPSVEESAQCWPYLKRQIELIQPDLILALGSIAAQRLLHSKSTLGRLRGQLHYIEDMSVPVIVTYHPAYLLRAPNEKRKAWEDLQMAMKELNV